MIGGKLHEPTRVFRGRVAVSEALDFDFSFQAELTKYRFGAFNRTLPIDGWGSREEWRDKETYHHRSFKFEPPRKEESSRLVTLLRLKFLLAFERNEWEENADQEGEETP